MPRRRRAGQAWGESVTRWRLDAFGRRSGRFCYRTSLGDGAEALAAVPAANRYALNSPRARDVPKTILVQGILDMYNSPPEEEAERRGT